MFLILLFNVDGALMNPLGTIGSGLYEMNIQWYIDIRVLIQTRKASRDVMS